uniref:HTH OST-type domain-containing protein n=1 Tax=Strongyloides papillosus TaxID=174720 RepID=A0A0N5BXB9_STREA
MDLENLFKKLRSSLSMRKNVPLSQLIRECNSDWNIDVYTIYSEISSKHKSDLKDIASWLGSIESVIIKNTNNDDYIVNFKFGDEHADLRRYISVSKPKKKRTNKRHASNLLKGFKSWKDSGTSNCRSRTRQYSTSLNNCFRQRINTKNHEEKNYITTKSTNFVSTVSNAGKLHLNNAILNATFTNRRLENQRSPIKLENEIIEKFSNVSLDTTNRTTDNSLAETKVSKEINTYQTEDLFVKKDYKESSEKSYGEKISKSNKKYVPEYIFGQDAIKAMLKDRKTIVATNKNELKNNQDKEKIMDDVKKNDEAQQFPSMEVRKPFAVLQSSNQEYSHLYETSIPNEREVKDLNSKTYYDDNKKKERFKFHSERKIERKTKFSYSFPKPSVQ